MGLMAHGGFAITSTGGTFNHHQGIKQSTLDKIIAALKADVTKPQAALLTVTATDIRSISIFTNPSGGGDSG